MNDDYISREEVLNLLDTAFENGAFDGRYAYENLVDAVQNLIHPLEADLVSRQAVIDTLETDCSWDMFNEWGSRTPVGECIIETIKRVPSVEPEIEKCGDCISKTELLKKLKKVSTESWKMKLNCRAELVWNQCIDFVEDAKSVEPERKTGHWEYTQDDYDPSVGNWHCSECKDIVVKCLTRVAEGRIPRYKYCSNCGCRMVELQESEDNV